MLIKETPALSPEKKENEDMFFVISVRTASGNLFTEMITAKDKNHAIEKMGNAFPSLTESELKGAEVKDITKEEYGKEQRKRYAIRENIR